MLILILNYSGRSAQNLEKAAEEGNNFKLLLIQHINWVHLSIYCISIYCTVHRVTWIFRLTLLYYPMNISQIFMFSGVERDANDVRIPSMMFDKTKE